MGVWPYGYCTGLNVLSDPYEFETEPKAFS
jgi:hypothetical protein